MEIIKDSIGDIEVVRPKGKLDTLTTNQFKEEVLELIDRGALKLSIDFSNIIYISSTGLSALLKFAKILKRNGGRLILFSMDDNVRNVFDVVGFSSIATILGSEEEALRAF